MPKRKPSSAPPVGPAPPVAKKAKAAENVDSDSVAQLDSDMKEWHAFANSRVEQEIAPDEEVDSILSEVAMLITEYELNQGELLWMPDPPTESSSSGSSSSSSSSTLPESVTEADEEKQDKVFCEACQKLFSDNNYRSHLSGKKHKNAAIALAQTKNALELVMGMREGNNMTLEGWCNARSAGEVISLLSCLTKEKLETPAVATENTIGWCVLGVDGDGLSMRTF